MKNLILIIGLLASASAHAIPVDDLKFSCTGKAEVVSTSDPYYSPERPPQGRFDGSPEAAGFKAQVKILSLGSGCETLSQKYHVDAKNISLEGHASTGAGSPEASKLAAKQAVGTVFSFHTEQKFSYVLNDKYLPFYPEIHGEKVTLSAESHGGASWHALTAEIPFDMKKVYGVVPLKDWDDEKKVALAEDLLRVLNTLGAAPHGMGDFIDLFLNLEPASAPMKKKYAYVIWKLFEEIKQSKPYTQFFDFNVGGPGFYVGAKFGKVLNRLSHLLDAEEKVALLYDFPQLLVAGGNFGANDCLAVGETEVQIFLEKVLAALPHQTRIQKGIFEKATLYLSQDQAFGCYRDGFFSAGLRKFAQEIYLKLKDTL